MQGRVGEQGGEGEGRVGPGEAISGKDSVDEMHGGEGEGRVGPGEAISGEDSEDEMSRGAERVDLERGAAATSDTTVISRGGIGPGGDTRLLVEGVCRLDVAEARWSWGGMGPVGEGLPVEEIWFSAGFSPLTERWSTTVGRPVGGKETGSMKANPGM